MKIAKNVENRKILRGLLLTRLYPMYPHGMLMESLRYAFMLLGFTSDEVDKGIAFLKERGYIEIMQRKFNELKNGLIEVVKITDKGIQLYEGDLKDPSILLPENATP